MINLQPILENEKILLHPLLQSDFEMLYIIASNPKVWEQHPNKNRWQKDVFQIFFEGAIQSKGAFKVIDKVSGSIAGSSRFYDYNEMDSSILIGYTFYGTAFWGKGINQAVKALMLDYIFQFVDSVYFHIGAKNIRSQIAIERTGAKKVDEIEVAYYGEDSKQNFVYKIIKDEWKK